MRYLLAATVATVVVAPAVAQPVFVPLAPLGGFTRSEVVGLSADGRTVFGNSTGSSTRGTRWTFSVGSYSAAGTGVFTGATDSYLYAGSADGLSAVGQGNRAGSTRANQWTSSGGLIEPLTAPPNWSRATGVSADGRAFVGYRDVGSSGTQYEAVRVTQTSPGVTAGQTITTLAQPNISLNGQPYVHSFPVGVSGNGQVTVGYTTQFNLGAERAVVWSSTGAATVLGDSDFFGRANAASADGSAAVGQGTFPFGQAQGRYAFRWTAAGGVQNLGTLDPAGGGGTALAVSADGAVVVGQTRAADGVSNTGFVWSQAAGQMVDFDLLLSANGVNAGGWDVSVVTAVTGDELAGYNFAGVATSGALTRGFVVVGLSLTPVPEPAGLVLLAAAGLAAGRRFLRTSGVANTLSHR